ncbi:DUF3592 domain-containing protein [Streptomyces sp. NPDC002825]|uniref:DUF3592 domain-containing protein n=1 Tax=Streptomyces sp. NPDC002825 TaxID=3154666 RepID=UPI00331E5331
MTSVDIVAGLGALMSGFVAVASLGSAWIGVLLLVRGKRIEAEVVGVREEKDTDGDTRYFPVVAFTPPGGARVEAESPTGKPHPPEWGRGPGSKVGVVYDPARPTRVQVDGYPSNSVFMALIAAAGSGSLTWTCVSWLLS